MKRILRPEESLIADRFSALEPLSASERSLLATIQNRRRRIVEPDGLILKRGAAQTAAFIIQGWAAEVVHLSQGRRQLARVFLPGDPIGLSRWSAASAPADIIALTHVSLADAPETPQFWKDRERVPGLAQALDKMAAEGEWFRIVQAARLGRQTARERMASWLCEAHFRMTERKLVTGNKFHMPLAQQMLADLLGLSAVHVNRTVQALKRERMLEISRGYITLPDVSALRSEAEFVTPKLTADRSSL